MRNLFLIFSICILASCSNDDESKPSIDNFYGSWEKTENISAEKFDLDSNYNYSVKQELNLNRDNSFEWFISIIKIDNGNIMGYRQKEIGTFSQNGHKLIFNFDRFQPEQNSESNPYILSTLENLILTDQNVTMDYNFKVFNNYKTLLFDFPNCEPNNTCPADIELNKVE
tara:strand:+ start:219 stop:728 length:510 start_codon:yes stop_codon:yes gene_type:complete